jgi:hypothetical protein
MEHLEQQMIEVESRAEIYKQALANGDLEWEDETIQYFLPVILHFTNFDWLRLIAENNLVEEDEKVVKDFLDMVQALLKVNTEQLEQSVQTKIKLLLKLMGEQ